jgi:hypothetical protein
MDEKLATARSALDSLLYDGGGSAAASLDGGGGKSSGAVGVHAATPPGGGALDRTTGSVRGRYASDDRGALLERLQTFRPGTWFGKPAPLSPQACALLGWRNVGPDRLACEFCGAKVSCPIAPGGGAAAAAAAWRFAELLTSNHAELCPWRVRSTPPALLAFPPAPAAALAAEFDRRAAGLRRLEAIPDLSAAAWSSLLSLAATAAGGGGEAAEGDAAEGEAAVATALGLTPQQVAAAAAGPGAAAAAASLPFDAAARLLALFGWEIQDLKSSSGGGGGGGLESRGSLDGDTPAVVPAARAALRCGMCAGSCGLWTLLRAPGPLGPRAKRSRAAQLATATREELIELHRSPEAARPQQQQQQQHEESPGVGGGSAEPAGGESGGGRMRRQESTPEEVALSLRHRTIAGGDLSGGGAGPFGAAPAAPAFGSAAAPEEGVGGFGEGDAAAPVFGLQAIDAEVRKRRRSGSAGGGSAGGGGEGPKLPVRIRDAAAPGSAGEPPAPALDPLSLHRPWCPWVAPPFAPEGSAGAGAGAAAAASVACGWVACMLALRELRGGGGGGGGGGAGVPGAAAAAGGGGPHAHVDARSVDEELRRSRAAMAAKVEAALDALGGA